MLNFRLKAALMALAFFLFLSSISAHAWTNATSIEFNNATFANSSEFYSNAFRVKVITNYTAGALTDSYNVSLFVNGTRIAWLRNDTLGNTTNATALVWNSSGANSVRWPQVAVNDTDGIMWANWTVFKINEKSPNTVNVSFNPAYGPNWYTANKSEFYTSAPWKINLNANETVSSCNIFLDGSATSLTAAANYTQYTNSSAVVWVSNNNVTRNMTGYCDDAYGNRSWINNSASMGSFFVYSINEFAPNTLTITDNSLSNLTVYAGEPKLNLTINNTVSYCYYSLNKTAGVAMSNASGVRTSYINSSALTWIESTYNGYHNLTYYCTDAYGNTSWKNSTAAMVNIQFKLDETNPAIPFTKYNGSLYNNNSIWNFTFNFTDRNFDRCGIRYYNNSGYSDTPQYFYGTYPTPVAVVDDANTNCTVLFNNTAMSSVFSLVNGRFRIEGWANDTAGNVGLSANVTGVSTLLSAGWNLITFVGANFTTHNMTVYEFVRNNVKNATSVSVFSNTYGNYTTYITSLSSINNDTKLYPGLAVYVYVTSNTWLINPDWTVSTGGWILPGNATENVTLYLNYTDKNSTSWNQIGLLNNVTMNRTLYACSANMANNESARAGTCPLAAVNISYASWYNASSGYYITCKQGLSICSGTTLTPTQIILPEGTAVWILPNVNQTILNRTAIY